MVAFGRWSAVVFGGIAGVVAVGTTWFLLGYGATYLLVSSYSRSELESTPHPHIDAVRYVWLIGTPAAAIVGGVIGTLFVSWLTQPRRGTNPIPN